MKELYRLDKSELIKCDSCRLKNCTVTKERITVALSGLKMCLYWNLITCFRACVYVVKSEDGQIIHYAYVVPRCYKFPFLRRGKQRDIEIGPCYTANSSRGLGIYPFVLTKIIENEINDYEFAYMIVEDWNHASIKGIQKVGFQKIGRIRKDSIRRYEICE